MPLRIQPHTSFEEALTQLPDMIIVVRALMKKTDVHERLDLLREIVLDVTGGRPDEQMQVLLQMVRKLMEEQATSELTGTTELQPYQRDRMAGLVAVARFREYLEKLFWLLPDRVMVQNPAYSNQWRDYHSEPVLGGTKAMIFRELLHEWVSEPTERSIYAFRRAIAMGWPLGESRTHLIEGEADIQLTHKARYVGQEEQKQCSTAVRERLASFADYGAQQKGADAVYGPWLLQKRVPEDIERHLVIARAKMGGIESARRDIRNAAILDGLPESGVVILSLMAEKMRRHNSSVEKALSETLAFQRKRYPHWRGKRIPATVSFVDTDELHVDIGGCEDRTEASAMFIDACFAITAVKEAGGFAACTVRLDVRQREDEAVLENYWYR